MKSLNEVVGEVVTRSMPRSMPPYPHCDHTSFSSTYIPPSSHHNPQLSQAHLHAYLYSRPANLQKPLNAFNCIAHNTPHDCSHKNKFSLSQTKSSFSWKHLKRIKLCKKITHTPFLFHIHSRLWFFDFGKIQRLTYMSKVENWPS